METRAGPDAERILAILRGLEAVTATHVKPQVQPT